MITVWVLDGIWTRSKFVYREVQARYIVNCKFMVAFRLIGLFGSVLTYESNNMAAAAISLFFQLHLQFLLQHVASIDA